MAALASFRLQRLPVLDLASGEPSRPCNPRLRKFFDRALKNEVIVCDENDTVDNEYSILVFTDENITAEEAAVHEQVEQTLRMRKLAAFVLQRWWRNQSICRRLANRLRLRLIKRSLRRWHKHSVFCTQRRAVRALTENAMTICQIRILSINRIAQAWRAARIRRFCKIIAAEGRNSLYVRRSANIILRQFSRYVAIRTSAVRIQRFWRRRRAIQLRIAAISSLQSWIWATVLSARYSRMMYYIRLLQTRYRRIHLRKTFRNVVLLSHRIYAQTRLRSVITVQARWRSLLCNRSLGGSFAFLRSKATVIQKYWRRFLARQECLRRKARAQATIDACSKIQTAYRRFVSRRRIKACRNMIACLHSGISASIFRMRFLILRRKAIDCQAGFLAVIAFDQHIDNVQSVRVLQYLFRRRQRRRQFRGIVELLFHRHLAKRFHAAVCIQALWRGFRCRSRFHCFSSLRCKVLLIQSFFQSHIAAKDSLRLKKHFELENRRQVLIDQLESLPDSRDQRLQSLRAKFSERLANIEGASPMQPCLAQSALPVKASILSALDTKRARLFRVKAQLDTVKSRKEAQTNLKATNSTVHASISNQDDLESQHLKVVRWRDRHGSALVDTVNHRCSPRTSAIPARPCIKITSNAVIPKKRAQRIMNVLSTTFGKAMSCKASSLCENSSKSVNMKHSPKRSTNHQASAKSPLPSGARRVKVTTKRSD